MPATRKVNHVSQEQDLEQMKNIFGTSSPSNSVAKSISSITPEFDGEPEIEKKEPAEHLHKEAEQDSNIITEEKKEVSDTTVGIRMTTAKKREMKAYFIQHGTTMSQGVLDAFTLLRKLEDSGVVEYKDGLLEISNA